MAHIEIDTAAITANVACLKAAIGRDVIAVVKAGAYGHGAEMAAAAALAGGASALATADIAEAVALRESGCTAAVLAWLHSADPDFGLALDHDVTVAISSVSHLDRAAALEGEPLKVHLKFDTGLGRNGIPESDWRAVIDRADALQQQGRIRVTGLMSHLAGTSAEADLAQASAFSRAVAAAEGLGAERIHLTASAGSLVLAADGAAADTALAAGNAVRIGIVGYGLHPDGADPDGSLARELGVKPALRLLARAEDGVLDVGYRDGLLHAPGAWALVEGERVAISQQRIGSTVLERPVTGQAVVIGDPAAGEPGAGEWAERVGTINYEIVTRLSHRLERRPAQEVLA